MKVDRRNVSPLPEARVLQKGQLVLLGACDSSYVRFAAPLVRSLEVFSPGHTIVLHIVNPTRDVLDTLENLSREVRKTRLVLSTEEMDVSGWTDAQQRTYYACARFQMVADLLAVAECDFLLLDVDSLVVNPIDRDFTDESDAEICLLQRDQAAEHLAIAAGSVWVRATPATREFFRGVERAIVDAFESGTADWYLDQILIKRQIAAPETRATVRNIKRKYVDWEFRDDSVVWQAKGARKYLDVRYLLLQGRLGADRTAVLRYEALYDEFKRFVDPGSREPLDRRLERTMYLRPSRTVFLLPRLDLPWKRQAMPTGSAPKIDDQTIELRLYWKRFLIHLANTCEAIGINVDIIEVPAWEITREYVESLHATLALVPHRCSLDFSTEGTPVLFYMQEYFRWMFVVDPKGWSAASSLYPFDPTRLQCTVPGGFDEYVARLSNGKLDSKFAQQPRQSSSRRAFWRRALQSRGWNSPSVFFPLQIPHDQSLVYFSDHDLDSVVRAVSAWAQERGAVLTLKAHPANQASMAKYRDEFPASKHLRWSDANIHDLIERCDTVFTVNSGVGFEALLHGKPIVTFGRAEYDCVTTHAQPDGVDNAWQRCIAEAADSRVARYRNFFDWFSSDYAVDMSRAAAMSFRLAELAAQMAAMTRREQEAAHE